MLLDRLTAAAERVLVDLVLDLLRRVGQVDRRVRIGRTHLGLSALQCRKEDRVYKRRFGQAQAGCDIASHAKVRILINGARNETRYVFGVLEYGRKCCAKARCGLYRRERDLANAIGLGEAEYVADLI